MKLASLCLIGRRCWSFVQTHYGRHEPVWMAPMMREPPPYPFETPYVGFREAHQFLVPQEPFFSPAYAGPSPYGEPPMARIPRTSSAMPAFHYGGSTFLEPRPGPLRSSSAVPAYAFAEVPYHNSPLSHGPARSLSSIPSFREPRESRPKQHKVGPVSMRLSSPPHL